MDFSRRPHLDFQDVIFDISAIDTLMPPFNETNLYTDTTIPEDRLQRYLHSVGSALYIKSAIGLNSL